MTKKEKAIAFMGALAVPGGLVIISCWWLITKCWHHYTQPFTCKGKGQTYVACLKCAKDFEYDLNTMKVGKELPRDWHRASTTGSRTPGLDRPVDKAQGRRTERDPNLRTPTTPTDPHC